MRRNILLTLLLVLITTVGVRAEVVPIQKQSVGTHAVTTNQQETILQLQEENKKLKEQLERTEMDKEIQRCRDYVDRKANDINDNLSHWLVILSVVVGAIITILGGGLGVLAPLYLNRKNDKVMQTKLKEATKQAEKAKEQAEKAARQVETVTNQAEKAAAQVTTATEQIATATSQVQEAKNQVTTAKEYAEKAGQALTAIEALKKQVDTIQTKINEDKTKAEDAAKAAKVSQLFAEAFNEKDSSKAIDLYTQLLALNPDNADAYYNRGNVRYDLGDKSGALSDYDKSISLNPDDAEAYNNRGVVRYDLGDKSGALSDYDKSIELNPDDATAYNNRGVVKHKLGDKSGALSDYDKSISLKPDYAEAYNNRGWLKIDLDDLAGSLSDCNRAISLKPDYAETYDSRAVCYRKMAEKETDEEKKKEYIALAKADEKKYNELTGGKKK